LPLRFPDTVSLREQLRREPQPFAQSLDLYRRGVDRLLQGAQLLPNRFEARRVSANAASPTPSPKKLVQHAPHYREPSDHSDDHYSRHLTVHLIRL
jgi:hypothetical protein